MSLLFKTCRTKLHCLKNTALAENVKCHCRTMRNIQNVDKKVAISQDFLSLLYFRLADVKTTRKRVILALALIMIQWSCIAYLNIHLATRA